MTRRRRTPYRDEPPSWWHGWRRLLVIAVLVALVCGAVWQRVASGASWVWP